MLFINLVLLSNVLNQCTHLVQFVGAAEQELVVKKKLLVAAVVVM